MAAAEDTADSMDCTNEEVDTDNTERSLAAEDTVDWTQIASVEDVDTAQH